MISTMKQLDNFEESLRTTDLVEYLEQAIPAFVRSMKAMNNGCFCSWHFFCSCWKKIMSVMECSNLKPYWDLGYPLSASLCSLPRNMWEKTFPMMYSREIPL